MCRESSAMQSQNKKFVIEILDRSTGCVCDEKIIETSNTSVLVGIVNPDGADIHPSDVYDLSRGELKQIEDLYGILAEGVGDEARLRSWRFTDELPYKVHTNRELALMLKGDKPLAVFTEPLPSNPDFDLIPEKRFAPYVESGLLRLSECVIADARGAMNRFVFYAVKGEEWRINAYILLKRTANMSGWNEGFERMEGSLLGYEDWQNDVYIERVFKHRV